MKSLFLFCFIAFLYLHAKGQDTTRRSIVTTTTVVRQTKLDTNELVYDENGAALRYYQYQRLLNTGQYSIRTHPPDKKRTLVKLTDEQRNSMNRFLTRTMDIRSPVLKENMALDIAPLSNFMNTDELKDKPLLLVFWNTGCPPCTESFADINSIVQQTENHDKLVILAITSDYGLVAAAKLKEKPLLNARIVSDAAELFKAYQLTSYPTYVVADKTHVVRFSVTGSSQIVIPQLSSSIKAVLAE